MEDLIKLKTAMDLIVTGLYEKERQKKKGEYFYSKRLIHGINLFQSLNYKYNPEGFDFGKMHEQSFITEYAGRPEFLLYGCTGGGQWFSYVSCK